MASSKQSDFINALLTTALILVPGIVTANVDCKGKAFHCINSTHFKICVDFGGVSKTVDDFLIPCPPSTVCTDSNYYECEIPTTSAPLARQSDVTNELFETTVTSPWELLDVNTLSPINNNEKSVEWLENNTIASPEIVSTAAGTETVEIVDYIVVNEVINEITTESEFILHKTTASDLSESNNSKSTNSIPNSYMTSLTITDETNDLSGHNISANTSFASVTIGNNSTTESKIWLDAFDTMTTSSNTKDDADFKSTNLLNSVITDSLKKYNLTAALTTENYSGTKSEISNDHKSFRTAFPDADKISTTLSFPLKSNDFRLKIAEEATKNYEVTDFDTSISMLEQVATTPQNIEGSDDFATTISSVPLKTDDLGLKISLTTETKEKTGTENETFITNNKVNIHFTTTTSSTPMVTESLQNTPNIEINLSVTSDSYSTSTEQYSTVSDKNSPTEIATTINEMYTNSDVNATGTENKTLNTNNIVNPHFTTTTLSAPMISEGLVNTPNIEIYLSDTSDSFSTSTEQYATVSYKNSPIETATTTKEMYTNANVNGIGTENKTLITNYKVNPHFTTTTLSAPMITEGLVNTPNIEIYLSDTSDSYSTSTEQYSTVSDKNSPTETATTINEMYTNANVNGLGTENKTLITNYKVNPHFTTTTLSAPMITEGLVNTPNIEIYLSDTSDSYSTSTEQYSTVSDKVSPTETATTINEMYTNSDVNATGTENKTLNTNNIVNPHFTTTTLSAAMITEGLVNTPNIEIYLSDTSDFFSTSTEQYSTVIYKNSPTETATTINEMYTNANVNGAGTENKTLITNNKVNPHFTITTLSASMITEGLVNTPNIEIYLSDTSDSYSKSFEQFSTVSDTNTPTEIATTTNELYTNATVTGIGTKNETFITNNEVNPSFTTTTLSAPMINESLINTQNIEINFNVTSDSYSASTEQYSTVRDNNFPIETAASTNVMYTYDVTKTSDSRLDSYYLNENVMNINRIDEISTSSPIQMEFNSTTTENVVLRDTLQVFSINEQNNLSSPVGSVVSLNAEKVTSSDITKLTTVTDLDQTNTQANILYTKASIVNENIIHDTDGTSTTKLDVTINENNLMRENIANSSTDINLTTRSDSSETNALNNTPERDTKSRTPTMGTVSDTYTTVTNKNFQVDEFSIYENDSSTKSVSDLPSTVGYDKELHTTAVNIVLKNTADTILTKEKSDISPQKSESHAVSDLINNEPLETTLQPTLAIDLTVNYISYDVNFSTTTVNDNKLHLNVAKKISNNTKEDFLMHENGTYENIIDEITSSLPQIAVFKSTAKAENVAASFIGSLNDTVEEFKMTGTSDLSPPVTTGSPSILEIIKTSLLSDITESYYEVNTEPHIDATKVKLPIFSTIDETIQNNSTSQNIVTETLDDTEDEHGSTRNFEIQQNEKITNFDSVSSPSVSLHFSKHNDNSTEQFNNRLKENDSDSNMMYGSSHPLNLSTSTRKSNTKYTAEHNTEHTINLTIIGNLTATTATQPRITINDTVLNFSALEPIFNLTVGNEITPTEYQNRPSTVNNVYDNIITTHSYIRDGTGESSHLTEADILKTTLLNENTSMNTFGTDLNPSALINDRYSSGSDDIYSGTSAKNTVTENYSYKNNRPDHIDSSTPVISVIDSFDLNTVISTLVTGSSSFADAYLPSNITSMEFEHKYNTKENVFTLTNVPKDSSQIFLTNEKPVHTATSYYRNVNSSTKSNTLKGTKVVELEQLVSKDTNKIFASDTTSDIGSLTTENTFILTPTLSKNINKDINTTKEKFTTDSAMSGGLYVQDKILKSVKSKHLQNTSIITNESPQYHKSNNIYNFTKQINNSVVVNTNANLYNANVKNIELKITEKKQNQTLDPVNKSDVNFNNLSINVENLTRHDQNSSYKNVPNKTRIGDMQLHFVINADKKQSLTNPVHANEDKRKVNINKISPVKVNNLPSDYEIERTKFKFNCDSRQRGKYSDKNDCQNFYICTGRDEPIIGKCPNNTVFSEILKQCTRNLSHCIRNNQFQCTSEGRFVDILSDKFYYICAKKVKGYIRFKFQCQKGYHLDKSKLKCILDTFNESLSAFDMDVSNEESSKTVGEKSTIESRSKEEKDSKKQKKDLECKKEGKFLYPDDCRKYYQCTKTGESKFRRKIKKCDSDEVFDSEMSKCVDEESYEC